MAAPSWKAARSGFGGADARAVDIRSGGVRPASLNPQLTRAQSRFPGLKWL